MKFRGLVLALGGCIPTIPCWVLPVVVTVPGSVSSFVLVVPMTTTTTSTEQQHRRHRQPEQQHHAQSPSPPRRRRLSSTATKRTTDAETETTETTTATTEDGEEEQETETETATDTADTLTKEELLLRLAETRQYYRERYATLQKTDAEICTRLLSTRLDGLHLNRCYLSHSTIGPHAGLGLFARRHIAAGELITLYPGDAVVLRTEADDDAEDEQDEEAKKKKNEGETMRVDNNTAQQRKDGSAVPVLPNNNNNKTRCTPLVTKIVFGDHVRVEDRTLGTVMSYASRGYEMELDDGTSIIGNPARTATSPWDPAYGAHYANDGARLTDFAPAARAQYANTTIARYNAANFLLESGAHVGMIATQPIAAEAEIFLSYGEGYWLSRLTDNHDDGDDDGTHPTATTTKRKTATTPAEAERMLQEILTGMSQRRKENTHATTLSSSTVNNNNNHKTDKDKDSPMSSRKKKQYKSKAKSTTKKKKKKGFGKE